MTERERAETEGDSGERTTEENREGKRSGEPERKTGGNEGWKSRAERRKPRKRGGERAGRVEATVRRKLEAGKGRNRDQVAES